MTTKSGEILDGDTLSHRPSRDDVLRAMREHGLTVRDVAQLAGVRDDQVFSAETQPPASSRERAPG